MWFKGDPIKSIKPPCIEEAFGWFECKLTDHFFLSDRNVWIVGEILEVEVKKDAFKKVLEVEVKKDAFKKVLEVELVKPLNHIWGEDFVTEMKITKFKRA